MRGVADGQHAGELAVVVRSGIVESRHLGHAVLVDPDGTMVASVGTPDTLVLPRSAVKPWQAATCRRVGASHGGALLDGPHLAVAAGSHLGTSRHLALVDELLTGAGLEADALVCPAVEPADGGEPTPAAYNCSGKHAAMLLACRANGWPVDGYSDPAHPLQVAIRSDLEAAAGEKVAAVAVDGCGAPLFGLSLRGLAHAASHLARGDEHQRAVVAAMRAHPWAVRGPGGSDTMIMQSTVGVVAKVGAEGVQLLATTDGWAVVVKVLDGAGRAATIAALSLLGRVPGIDVAEVIDSTREPILGGGRPVGGVSLGKDLT